MVHVNKTAEQRIDRLESVIEGILLIISSLGTKARTKEGLRFLPARSLRHYDPTMKLSCTELS